MNSFSANWKNNKTDANAGNRTKEQRIQMGTEMSGKDASPINRMYQIKKWQYVFYKHVILHGLNISVAFPNCNVQDDHDSPLTPLPLTMQWRIFWLALNASYAMEFFLQSMVKRGVLSQRLMMLLNGLLMASSSVAAVGAVFGNVRWEAALISLVLNFGNRHHDILNTMVTGCVVANIRM